MVRLGATPQARSKELLSELLTPCKHKSSSTNTFFHCQDSVMVCIRLLCVCPSPTLTHKHIFTGLPTSVHTLTHAHLPSFSTQSESLSDNGILMKDVCWTGTSRILRIVKYNTDLNTTRSLADINCWHTRFNVACNLIQKCASSQALLKISTH